METVKYYFTYLVCIGPAPPTHCGPDPGLFSTERDKHGTFDQKVFDIKKANDG